MLFSLAGMLKRIHACTLSGADYLIFEENLEKMPPQSIGIETPLTNKPFHLQTIEYW